LGQAMGFLVGALVLGTAFPHLLKGLGETLHWNSVDIVLDIFGQTFMVSFNSLSSASIFIPSIFLFHIARGLKCF